MDIEKQPSLTVPRVRVFKDDSDEEDSPIHLRSWSETKRKAQTPEHPQQRRRSARDVVAIGILFSITLLLLAAIALHKSAAPITGLAGVIKTPYNPNVNFSSISHHHSRNAYAVMLSADAYGEDNDLTDTPYFLGTRTLIYSLLHDPVTRGSGETDFIVLVSGRISQKRRDRLTADGAIVIDAPHILDDDRFSWISPGGFGRWLSVLDKLEVFRMTQYERILLLDTDVIVVRPIEGIFDSPEVAVLQHNLEKSANVKEDEPRQPSDYVMAATCNSGRKHTYPTTMCDSLNAGFVVLKPSLELYEHYLGVMMHEGRFSGEFPEQDLWNYVHRKEGNMPWTSLGDDWNIVMGNWEDYEHGVRSFHEKYWAVGGDQKLTAVMNQVKGMMEGFWRMYGVDDWRNT